MFRQQFKIKSDLIKASCEAMVEQLVIKFCIW